MCYKTVEAVYVEQIQWQLLPEQSFECFLPASVLINPTPIDPSQTHCTGPFTFQGGWGGPAMNGGDYQAAAQNWAKAITEMEKAFEASGGRTRPGMFNNWRDMAGAVENAMGTLALPVDLEEGDDAFILRADIPGMEKSDLKVRAPSLPYLTFVNSCISPHRYLTVFTLVSLLMKLSS